MGAVAEAAGRTEAREIGCGGARALLWAARLYAARLYAAQPYDGPTGAALHRAGGKAGLVG